MKRILKTAFFMFYTSFCFCYGLVRALETRQSVCDIITKGDIAFIGYYPVCKTIKFLMEDI